MTDRVLVPDLLRLVQRGEADILRGGSFLLGTGELFTAHGRPTKHGRSGYLNHFCRCTLCSAAEVEASAISRTRRREERRIYWANVFAERATA